MSGADYLQEQREEAGGILTKEFPLDDVLTCINETLLHDGIKHIDSMVDILNWMTGDCIVSNEIPHATRICGPALIKQFPQLNPTTNLVLAGQIERLIIALKTRDAETITVIWRDMEDEYGKSLQVAPLQPFDGWDRKPLSPETIVVELLPTDDFPTHI
jgi:hypothetical protein